MELQFFASIVVGTSPKCWGTCEIDIGIIANLQTPQIC
jgi:hypothetical protein